MQALQALVMGFWYGFHLAKVLGPYQRKESAWTSGRERGRKELRARVKVKYHTRVHPMHAGGKIA